MKFNNIIKTILAVVLFMVVTNTFAQPPGSEPDPGGAEDNSESPLEPGAPIADFILPMLMVGVATAYVLLRKKATSHVI